MISQPEFDGFPEGRKSTETLTATFQRLTEEHGVLVPQNVLGEALGVSKQRVSQFMAQGRFHVFKLAGQNFVPLLEIQSFERMPGGRPKTKKA